MIQYLLCIGASSHLHLPGGGRYALCTKLYFHNALLQPTLL
jgi:hypothetical protein